MSGIIQTFADPVNGQPVEVVHAEDVRMMIAENEKMKAAIIEFCKEQDWACDEWKRQSHIAPLFKLANNYIQHR